MATIGHNGFGIILTAWLIMSQGVQAKNVNTESSKSSLYRALEGDNTFKAMVICYNKNYTSYDKFFKKVCEKYLELFGKYGGDKPFFPFFSSDSERWERNRKFLEELAQEIVNNAKNAKDKEGNNLVPSFEDRVWCMRAGGTRIVASKGQDSCFSSNGKKIDYQAHQKRADEVCKREVFERANKKEITIKKGTSVYASAFDIGKCKYTDSSGKERELQLLASPTPQTRQTRQTSQKRGNGEKREDKGRRADQGVDEQEKGYINGRETGLDQNMETQLQIMKKVLREQVNLGKLEKDYHETMIRRITEDAQEIMNIQEEILEIHMKMLAMQNENQKELAEEMNRLTKNVQQSVYNRTQRYRTRNGIRYLQGR